MSYKLFLDDERWPDKVTWVKLPLGPWAIVRDYRAFVYHITKHGLPSFVTFDHDLAHEHYPAFQKNGGINNFDKINYEEFKEKTGYDCAKWLCDYCAERNLEFPDYAVHSMNPIGCENISKYIESYKRSRT